MSCCFIWYIYTHFCIKYTYIVHVNRWSVVTAGDRSRGMRGVPLLSRLDSGERRKVLAPVKTISVHANKTWKTPQQFYQRLIIVLCNIQLLLSRVVCRLSGVCNTSVQRQSSWNEDQSVYNEKCCSMRYEFGWKVWISVYAHSSESPLVRHPIGPTPHWSDSIKTPNPWNPVYYLQEVFGAYRQNLNSLHYEQLLIRHWIQSPFQKQCRQQDVNRFHNCHSSQAK